MMTRIGAIEYGKRIGVRYYLENVNGGLYGGYTTKEAAEKAKKKFEAEDKKNPWTKGKTRFVIVEA